MIEAVLFDLGNTLMRDTAGSTSRMLEATGRPIHDWLVQMGLRPPSYPAYLKQLRRTLFWECVRSKLRGREVPLARTLETLHRKMGIPVDPDHIRSLSSHCLPALRRFFVPDEESGPVLRRLSEAGLRLGVVSNTMVPGFAMDEHLRNENMIQYLPVRVYSSDVGFRKPRREIYQLALDQLPASAERTLFVGDSAANDVRGPFRLGMFTALLRPTGRSPRRGPRPHYVIRRLSEVLQILLRSG